MREWRDMVGIHGIRGMHTMEVEMGITVPIVAVVAGGLAQVEVVAPQIFELVVRVLMTG
jgi:hypothetical protein